MGRSRVGEKLPTQGTEEMKAGAHYEKHLWGLLLVFVALSRDGAAADNRVYQPCQDTTVALNDGFSFGFVVSANATFYNKNVQLSPCDKRLTQMGGGQVAVFRPQIDQISLLIINISQLNPQNYGGYGVAYAGSKYAAVSQPVFLANATYHVTSLSLVMNFDKGRLINLLWKNDDCASCKGKYNTTFVCLKGGQCAIKTSLCNSTTKTKVDCSLSIQTTFSGTDKDDENLNSWYEFSKIRQYSLYALYSNLRQTLKSQFHIF